MRKRDYQYQEPGCPTEVTAGVIGGKWKTLILTLLLPGPRRFGEISRFLPQTSKRMLTLQLRELEEDGVIHREIYKEVPPKVEYSLTECGKTLKPILLLMADWGEKYIGSQADAETKTLPQNFRQLIQNINADDEERDRESSTAPKELIATGDWEKILEQARA